MIVMTTTGTGSIEYALNAPARLPLIKTAERRRSGERAILSPDGRFLAVPGENHTVLVLDATTNQPWVTYYGHQAGIYRRVSGIITALAWLPDGSCIASGSTDGSIHLWHGR